MPKSATPELRLTRSKRAVLELAGQDAAALDRQRLTRTIAFRLTESDHAAYLEKYKASGMTQSEFFRDCVLTNKTQVVAKQKASPEKKVLLSLLNKCGNNINQLAYRANRDYANGVIEKKTYLDILFNLQNIALLLKTGVFNAD